MKYSCSYCGRMHEKGTECPKRLKKKRYDNTDSVINKFRHSKQWLAKREHIRGRDLNLCQSCFNMLVDEQRYLNSKDLSIHHIYSLQECWSKRLDDDNLITLCRYCHELAERGQIDKEVLQKIAIENREKHFGDEI